MRNILPFTLIFIELILKDSTIAVEVVIRINETTAKRLRLRQCHDVLST